MKIFLLVLTHLIQQTHTKYWRFDYNNYFVFIGLVSYFAWEIRNKNGEDGGWKREEGRWKLEEGRGKMEEGRWKREEGRWKMEVGKPLNP
jgi:hypothetical protein